MPSAQELGYLGEGSAPATALEAGMKLEITKEPEFKDSNSGKEYALIQTKNGLYYSFGSAIIGALRSNNEKSIGQLIKRAISDGKTLTVWVTSHKANNDSGRDVLGLSAFKPRA